MNLRPLLALAFAACATALPVTPATAAKQPNIIVIYTDDHGYADIGIQGPVSDVKTPHIDALARSGAGGKKITISIARSGVGQFYQVVAADTVTDAVWPAASPVQMGHGGRLEIVVPVAPGSPRKFYKVRIWRE